MQRRLEVRLRTGTIAGALLAGILMIPAEGIAQSVELAPAGIAQTGSVGAATPAPTMPLGAPVLGAAERARLQAIVDQGPLPGPAVRQAGIGAGAPAGSETALGGDNERQAPGSFLLYSSRTPNSVIPLGNKSSIDEPSAGMSGRVRFMTGNWYAAFSNTGGSSWTYLSPFTAFPASDGGFCCDQVALYDQSRDMMIWLLQYIKSGNTTSNRGRFRIALFRDTRNDIGPSGWIFYDFLPANVGGPGTGEWFDYPHMTLSNDFLYVAINVFRTTNNTWTRTVLFRLPLDNLRAGSAFSYNYISWTANFTFMPIQGAKDVMYWASHNSNSSLRIFRWAETSGSYNWFDRNIAAWNTTSHVCTTSDGFNWCGRSDNRVLAGAESWNQLTKQGELWWFWNVGQDPIITGPGRRTFNWPYIEAAKFRETDLAYLSRPLIWNPDFPFHYVSAAPNGRGDIGLSLFYGPANTRFPTGAACIDDDFNGDPPGWECINVRGSTAGPARNGWGDYVAVRPAYPATMAWLGTTFTQQGGTSATNVEPRSFIFGRERDYNDYLRWATK